MAQFDIVASTQNNPYMEWQAMLFHFSCLQHMGQAPIVVVHKNDEPLLSGFQLIQELGGNVQTAPDYSRADGIEYLPRNTAATLHCAESEAEYLVLCDPDIVFLRRMPLEDYVLTGRQVTFDELTYLHLDEDEYGPIMEQVAPSAGVPIESLRRAPINGGVPHIIPTSLKAALSEDWLACMNLFPSNDPDASSASGSLPWQPWLTTMWALVLAVHRLSLEPVLTRFCLTNHNGHRPFAEMSCDGPMLIHYCYGDEGFDKRRYMSERAARRHVWNATAVAGTIHGAVCTQLSAARQYYHIPILEK